MVRLMGFVDKTSPRYIAPDELVKFHGGHDEYGLDNEQYDDSSENIGHFAIQGL
jgi:hypothetical protein